MNYVFRGAILGYLKGVDAYHIMEGILCIMENYPRPVIRNLINFVTTHDTERTLTLLAGEPLNGRDRNFQNSTKMTPEQRAYGLKLMHLAAGLMFTLPGFPCIYYGDEAGVEGYKDPFNRSTYPWGKEDTELVDWHRKLAKFRRSSSCFNDGEFKDTFCKDNIMSFVRYDKDCKVFCIFNSGNNNSTAPLPRGFDNGNIELTTHDSIKIENHEIQMPPLSCAFVKVNE